MRIDVFTIFPGLIEDFTQESLLGKARERGILDLNSHDLREYTDDNHRTVDDSPYGGGAGMVMGPDPIFRAVEATNPPRPLFLMGPSGRTFDQAMARTLAGSNGFSLLCGRYEGIDQRVNDQLIDEEISVGDYVLAGGEVAALTIIEAVTRLVPGVMGNDTSAVEESFSEGLLEYPHYTRPAQYNGLDVPDVLLSGDHARVARWRRAQSLAKTLTRRPDLIASREDLSDDDRRILEEFDL